MRKLLYMVLVCAFIAGPACITLVRPGGNNNVQKPAAFIDLISPSSLAWGKEVTFTGYGTTSSGTIKTYRWRSSIDGDMGTQSTFTTKTLSPGKHIVLFSVQDSAGNWSLETQGTVNVMTEAAEDAVGTPDGGDTGTPPPADSGSGIPAPTPSIVSSFSAAPTGITAGSTSTLSWSIENATVVTIDHGVGSVGLTGTRVVSPAIDTTYTLTAANTVYFSQATARVTVAAAAASKPDLTIEDVWKSGDKIYYRIKNQGTAASPATVTKLTIDGALKSTDSAPALAAGAASTQNFTAYAYSCSGVSDSVVVAADSTNVAMESNGGNNTMTKSFSCVKLEPVVPPMGPLLAMKPDLKITDIACVPAGWAGLAVKVTIRNTGTLNSTGFDIKLYRDGGYRDTINVPGGIVAGGQATFTFPTYNHGCAPGSHSTMRAIADTVGVINESDETNNSYQETWDCPP